MRYKKKIIIEQNDGRYVAFIENSFSSTRNVSVEDFVGAEDTLDALVKSLPIGLLEDKMKDEEEIELPKSPPAVVDIAGEAEESTDETPAES